MNRKQRRALGQRGPANSEAARKLVAADLATIAWHLERMETNTVTLQPGQLRAWSEMLRSLARKFDPSVAP